MAQNSLVMMTAGTGEIVMTVDTTHIAGVTIAEVTATMVNEVTEVIDTGAGTVLRWGLLIYVFVYCIFWYEMVLILPNLTGVTAREEAAHQWWVWWRTPLGWWLLWAWLQRRPSWWEGEQDHHAPGSAHEHFRGRCKLLLSPPPKSCILKEHST